jgi:hypothetical protein
MSVAAILRAKAYEHLLNAEHQDELEQKVSADDFRAIAIALVEVAEALEEEGEAA